MPKIRILIVEDQVLTAESLRNILTASGYDVPDSVTLAEEAIEKADQLRPDLVLMDIKLAGEMDGIEAAEQIRTLFDIPVVYLTAYADEDTLRRAKISEPFGYVLKPFRQATLRSTIEMALYKHRLDRRLRESEQRYRTLFETMTEGVANHELVYDEDGTVVDYVILSSNHAFQIQTGLAREAIIGRRASQVYRADPPPYLHTYEQVAITGAPAQFQAYFAPMDKYLRVSVFSPARGQFATIIENITERVLAEEQIRQQKELLENTIEALSHPFYVINAEDHTVEMANSAARDQAYDPEAKTCYAMLHQGEKPCEDAHPCPLERVKEARAPVKVEHAYQQADERIRYVEIHGHPIFDGNGRVVKMIEYSFDITERKLAEQEREKLIAELQAVLAQVKTLSGLLPICANCKKIRDDQGYWTQVEDYIRDHSEARFSHGLCPDCGHELYPDFYPADS